MRLRVAAHPLHPMLVHFPLALWPVSLFCDVVGWWRGEVLWWEMSLWCLVFGCAVAALALIAGFLDYVSLPQSAPVLSAATTHMMLMLAASSAFTASLLLRVAQLGHGSAPTMIAAAASLVGLVFLIAGGWLGAKLVYGYGVGRVGEP